MTEIAADLQRFLHSRDVDVTVRTAVVVVHDRASLGSLNRATVDLLCIGPDQLLGFVQRSHPALDAKIRDKIARLIRRDHAFHAARQAPRKSR